MARLLVGCAENVPLDADPCKRIRRNFPLRRRSCRADAASDEIH